MPKGQAPAEDVGPDPRPLAGHDQGPRLWRDRDDDLADNVRPAWPAVAITPDASAKFGEGKAKAPPPPLLERARGWPNDWPA